MLALLLAFSACEPDDNSDKGGATPGDDTDAAATDDTDAPPGEDPRGGLVAADCVDGRWTEALADPGVDIGAIKRDFDTLGPVAFLQAALEARYPTGAFIFAGGLANQDIGDCVQLFTSNRDRSSANGMLDASSTLVHECGHFFDIGEGSFRGSTYVFTESFRLTCEGGSYNDTPPRSLLQADAYAPLRPACPGRGEFGCDSYANIYLDGDPENRDFESGDQGLDTVVEEAVQYINSLATDYAFSDRLGASSVSARDGILTFLWYIERYLRHMRVETPRVYGAILADDCWRDAILTVWGRAWLYLTATKDIRPLGIDDDDLMVLVTDPDLLAEIEAVRAADGCAP